MTAPTIDLESILRLGVESPSTEGAHQMLIFKIKTPKKIDSEAFVKFLTEEYLPAVHRGPTRVGQITGLVLLQATPPGDGLYLNVEWSGLPRTDLPIDDPKAKEKFAEFGAKLKFSGSYDEVRIGKARRRSS